MGKGTFLFVHGSGNRADQANAYGKRLREKLGLDENKLVISSWGVDAGPDPNFPDMYKVLPPVPQGIGDDIDPAAENSLSPLKALAPPPGLAAAQVEPRPDTNLALAIMRSGAIDLQDIDVTPEMLKQAADEVAASPEFQNASAPDAKVMDATIRSVVARAVKKAPASPGIGAPSLKEISDKIGRGVAAVGQTILNGAGAIVGNVVGDVVGSGIGDAAKLELSKRLAPHRLEIMKKNILVAADVLAYQRRGAAMRAAVAKELDKCEPPVVAMGHSLGGILLVDALFGPSGAKHGCELLITFGSQSAMLAAIYAIDAVTPSVPWINIWTRYDFVSFLAGNLWPNSDTKKGAIDKEVHINVGFPDSHGMYYETDEFYDVIRAQPVAKAILE